MNTDFPYKDQLEKIGDHSIEELMHLQLVQKIESDTAKLDELESHLDEVTYLQELQNAILLKGVTPAIFQDYQDHMWSKYEFDLEPFVNGSNEQLTYCMEGLGSIITRILLKIKEIITAVMEWFSTESIFKTWFNNMSFYKRQLNILYSEYGPKRDKVRRDVYGRQFISGYDYATYTRLLAAMNVFIMHIRAINVPADITTFGDKSSVDALNDRLYQCGYVLDGTHIYATGEVTYRRDTILAMGWNVSAVFGKYNDLQNYIFKHDLDLSKLKYALTRATIQWSRNIDELLKNKVPMTDAQLNNAQTMKISCVLLKRLTRLVMQQCSGMAAQWCRMVRLIDVAMPAVNGMNTNY